MKYLAGYKKLIVWQKSDELALLIYKTTIDFPKSELFSITSQLRRSALSIPTNIVEGYARNSRKEFKRFVIIALGSLAEVKYLLSVAYRLKYLSTDTNNDITVLAEDIGKLLWKFYKTL
jgi:four helix bundle protein